MRRYFDQYHLQLAAALVTDLIAACSAAVDLMIIRGTSSIAADVWSRWQPCVLLTGPAVVLHEANTHARCFYLQPLASLSS